MMIVRKYLQCRWSLRRRKSSVNLRLNLRYGVRRITRYQLGKVDYVKNNILKKLKNAAKC
jgi:hypothetical protein